MNISTLEHMFYILQCWECLYLHYKTMDLHFSIIHYYLSTYDSVSSDIRAPIPARSYNGTSFWVISVVSTATSIRACLDGLSIQKDCNHIVHVFMLWTNYNSWIKTPGSSCKHTTAVFLSSPTCNAGKYISSPLSKESLLMSWRNNIDTKTRNYSSEKNTNKFADFKITDLNAI